MNAFRTACAVSGLTLALLVSRSSAAEVDKYLPADSNGVVSINVRQLLDSPLIKQRAQDALKTALKQNAEARNALTATGIDPLKDVDRVTVAFTGVDREKVLVIGHGHFNLDKITAAAEDEARKNPERLKISKKGGLTIYENVPEGKGPAQTPFYSAFADNSTFVGSPSRDMVAEAARASSGSGQVSKDLQALIGKADDKQSLWLAALAPKELKDMLAKNENTKDIADKIESFAGNLDVDKDIRLDFHVYTSDEKAADSISELLDTGKNFGKLMAQNNPQYGKVVGEVIDSIKVSTSKGTVNVSLKVTEEMIQNGLKSAAPRAPREKPAPTDRKE